MDIFKMMKEVGQLKSKFQDMQNTLKHKNFVSEIGGAAVTLNGLFEVVEIKISDEAYKSGRQNLELLLNKNFDSANRQAREFVQKEFKGLPGGGLGGLNGLLGG